MTEQGLRKKLAAIAARDGTNATARKYGVAGSYISKAVRGECRISDTLARHMGYALQPRTYKRVGVE